MWVVIGGISALLLLFIIILAKLGFIEKNKVNIEELGPFLIIYSEDQGSSEEELEADLKNLEEKLLSHFFSLTQRIKITYDNHEALKNPQAVRSVFGLVIEDAENPRVMERALTFCEIYQSYSVAVLPEALAVGASYTKRSKALNKLYLHGKLYPQMISALLTKLKSDSNAEAASAEFIGLIEIENRRNDAGKTFVYIPFGAESRKYFLSTFPEPDYISLVKKAKAD